MSFSRPSIKSEDVIFDLLVISPSNFNNSKSLKFLTKRFPQKMNCLKQWINHLVLYCYREC